MKKLFGLLMMVLAVALLATACSSGGGEEESPVYPNCASNGDCAAKGEVCVDKVCRECGKESDCKNPCTTCKANRCEAQANCCTTDKDCPEGQNCKAKPGKKEGTCGTL